MNKATLPLSLIELGNRVGDTACWQQTFSAPDEIGTSNLAVTKGTELSIEIYGVAIDEGVSVSLSGHAPLEGKCVRCLKSVSRELDFSRTEIYYYPDRFEELLAEAGEEAIGDYDERYQLFTPNELDLEPLLIDAIVPNIPFSVLCEPDCPGLCPDCGVSLAEAEPGHHHEKIDPRWSALADFFDGTPSDTDGEQVDTND